MKRLLVVTALRFETGSFNLVAIMVQRGALLTLAGRAFFIYFLFLVWNYSEMQSSRTVTRGDGFDDVAATQHSGAKHNTEASANRQWSVN